MHEYCDEYAKVAETYPQYARMNDFFGRGAFAEKLLPNEQVFDFDGLRGRLRSSSYAPPQGHPKHEPMLAALRKLFDAHAEDGRVRFEYETHVYYGRLEAGAVSGGQRRRSPRLHVAGEAAKGYALRAAVLCRSSSSDPLKSKKRGHYKTGARIADSRAFSYGPRTQVGWRRDRKEERFFGPQTTRPQNDGPRDVGVVESNGDRRALTRDSSMA